MEIMTRFQLYLLIIIFGTFALLLQTGIPETWHWKSKENSFIKQFSNQGFGDKIGMLYHQINSFIILIQITLFALNSK